jgi:hypothetical protein
MLMLAAILAAEGGMVKAPRTSFCDFTPPGMNYSNDWFTGMAVFVAMACLVGLAVFLLEERRQRRLAERLEQLSANIQPTFAKAPANRQGTPDTQE